jgi:hypothetical protein
MLDAKDVNGSKVWVQLEWEQVDAMIMKELKENIEITARSMWAEKNGEGWVHPKDVERNAKLLHALFTVYEYWAGEEAAATLKQNLEYDNIGV